MHRERHLLGLLIVLICGGCGSAPETVAVQGRLEIVGQKADNVSVQFVPDSAGAGTSSELKAWGVTDGEGRFVLRCEDGRAGAVPGRYHVLLDDLNVYANPRNDMPPEQRKKLVASRIPNTYRAAGSTPLKLTVEPKAQEIALEVKP